MIIDESGSEKSGVTRGGGTETIVFGGVDKLEALVGNGARCIWLT